jgi:hypothetical protein
VLAAEDAKVVLLDAEVTACGAICREEVPLDPVLDGVVTDPAELGCLECSEHVLFPHPILLDLSEIVVVLVIEIAQLIVDLGSYQKMGDSTMKI